jgi:metal-responsive CopG/Arc/MetJ family transcriptional regulator
MSDDKINRTRVSLSIQPGLLRDIDRIRGDVPRSRWVARALNSELKRGRRR